MKLHRILRRIGHILIEFADDHDMAEAQRLRLADELGVSLEVPSELVLDVRGKPIEITDEMRRFTIEARELVSCDEHWLRKGGPRDRVCVRLGLMPEQVAGILARDTYNKRNGNAKPAPAAAPTKPPPADGTLPGQLPLDMQEQGGSDPDPAPEGGSEDEEVDLSTITHEPNTWPARESRNGADFPPKGKKEYTSDKVDLAIVQAILDEGGNDRYQELRRQVAITRRLTGQQVAELKARITRQANRDRD